MKREVELIVPHSILTNLSKIEIVVRTFNYILCTRLDDERQKHTKKQIRNSLHEVNDIEMKLERIKRGSSKQDH